MCMVLMHAWLVFLFTKGIIKWNIPTVSKCDNEKSPVNIIVVTITISLCCVIGMVLCAVGMSICQKCTSSDDNTGLILAIVGFVLVVVGLVVDILYVCIFQKKTDKKQC
ncbi:uncharacterized protein [Argopecten irradians]|uniref:uncharacterized protein isoform X3 n=1 Tax=Argopecten irradians TaxID=31199 RepID=UPI0037151E06